MTLPDSYAESASNARRLCRDRGLADCIHYAPNWRGRADSLYRTANASGLPWWRDHGAGPGLLADGRMVLDSDVACWFEPAPTVRDFRTVRLVAK